MMQVNEFTSRIELDSQLADSVAKILQEAVNIRGKASIAVSGGSTPKGFFKALSNKALPWKNITVTLVDERWVNINDEASNTRLIHENLLQNHAKQANFFHLKQGEALTSEILADLNLAVKSALLPFDVLILGMGEDGHTASIFPCCEQLSEALNLSNDDALIKTTPQTAPHQRITFTLASLLTSKYHFLHISGLVKKEILNKALAGFNEAEMPIRAFLQHPSINTQVYWAE